MNVLLILYYSQEVRLAAINALINSLDFIKENFEREVGTLKVLNIMLVIVTII